jgi:hypothetical protein
MVMGNRDIANDMLMKKIFCALQMAITNEIGGREVEG